jgi:murein DD-endopeptidase MepM/ murein hydrolase activator NlpD
MSTGVSLTAFRRAPRAASRCCSFRYFFAVMSGAALALMPLLVTAPNVGSSGMLAYAPQYPHQAYGYELALTRLQRGSPAGEWVAAADRARLVPQSVGLQFQKAGEQARGAAANGYAFSVPVGRRITVNVTPEGVSQNEIFVDVFRAAPITKRERVAGVIPGGRSQPLVIEVVDGGDYVLRVQPTLGADARYDVNIASRPLLAFPVQGVDGRAIWSGFGAERDGGRRAHRGVDIFAPRGTPVLAAIDGFVTRVETTRVGGNVIWMQPLFGNIRIYYAHLNEQWVEPGDFVLAGQPLGAVGNTGNAITTPPHLHFGVYVRRRGGAQDPAEFLR